MAARMNAAEFLLSVGDAQRTALECASQRMSYSELRLAVARAAGAWRSLGLAPGERVMILAPDSIDWVVAYLGVLWAGGVAMGVNPRLERVGLFSIAADSEARYLWTSAELAPAVAETIAVLPRRLELVVAEKHPAGVDWQAALARAEAIAPVQRAEEDAAVWIITSGTTGLPKAVMHAQRMVLETPDFHREVMGLNAEARLFATSKLFFSYALGLSLFGGLALGATVILDGQWGSPERTLEIAERHHPTVLMSVPTLYQKMLRSGIAAKLAQAGLRHYISAGESLPASVRREWLERTGSAPVNGYGASETVVLTLYSDNDDGNLQPTPGTTVSYPEGGEVGAPRRLWLAHRSVSLGYWNRPKEQEDAFKDGRFCPGDLFLRHADGRLEFAGRTDDMLKVSGQWVSLLALESGLLAACGDAVIELAAAGYSGADGLSQVVIAAVAVPGKESEAQARMETAVAALPGYRRPQRIEWGERALPRTATGKLQRRKLVDMLDRNAL